MHIWILLFFSVPLNVLILGVTMGSMSATQLDIFCSDSTETKLTKISDITTDSNTTTQTRQQGADSVHKTRRLA